MATKKFLELQEMSDADLQTEKVSTQEIYQKMKFEHAVKGLDNPISIKEVRKDIARLNTEIRRREVANMSEAQIASRSKMRARRSSNY